MVKAARAAPPSPRSAQAPDLLLDGLAVLITDGYPAGALEVITDRIFPFDQIADAFAYLEQGRAKGKVIVQMV